MSSSKVLVEGSAYFQSRNIAQIFADSVRSVTQQGMLSDWAKYIAWVTPRNGGYTVFWDISAR